MPRRDKSEQIMLAAEKLFTSRQLHEITLEDVAEAAKVGKGTIYRYFKDKDDLFLQTATSGFEELCDVLRRKVPEDARFEEQLLAACAQISAFFQRRRQLFRMMQAEGIRMHWCKGEARERWLAKRKKLVAAVGDIIGRGAAEGVVRADLPPEVLAHFLLGMLRTRGRALAEEPEEMRRYEVVVDLFLNGAGSVPGDAGASTESS